MLRIFFVTIFCFTIALCEAAISASPQLETLDQINADLRAKKSKDIPDVKVDLESLGLDEIDAKDNKSKDDKAENKDIVKDEAPQAKTVISSSDLPDIKKNKIEKTQLIEPAKDGAADNKSAPITLMDRIKAMQQKIDDKNKDQKPTIDGEVKTTNSDGALSRIGGFIRKTISKDAISEVGHETVSPTSKDDHVNPIKKQNLKNQAAAKKAAAKKAAENEKKNKAKLEKLNKLRAKYLTKLNTDKKVADRNEVDEDLSDADTNIVPQRKNINKFVSYETPAPPIMNRYRSQDNKSIPLVITDKEKADNLFRSIGEEDISYFNSAYQDIENPNLRNYAGDTVLTYSILLQKRNVVASILAKGADPDLPNGLGYTPLQITIESLDLASFNILVNSNADVNAIDGFGRTYLMHAARVGFLPAMEILIKKGVDVNALDYDGFSALAIANRYKQDLSVTLLLKHGAKPWVEKPYDPESESIIKQLDNKWKK